MTHTPKEATSSLVDDGPPASLAARQQGFSLCVRVLRRTLAATPAGWALVAWLTYGVVPTHQLAIWIGGFALCWLTEQILLARIERQGCDLTRHHLPLLAVALLDGLAWGAVLLLAIHDRFVGAWLMVVLCGVVAVNMPTYIFYQPAYRVLLASVWVGATVSELYRWADTQAGMQVVSGLAMYFLMLAFTLSPVSKRLIKGIQWQLDNAALADRLKAALVQMEHQATTDALTGQMNRHALDALMTRYVEAGLSGFRFSLLILDIDHFKHINDTHGHPVGDQALYAVAKRVALQLKAADSCARYGGEEFVVVLPDTGLAQAIEMAERIQNAVQEAPLETQPALEVTVSIGVTQFVPGMTAHDVLKAADEAVYAAKRDGRNRVAIAETPDGIGGPTLAGG